MAETEDRITVIVGVLETLIAWLAQSAASPLSIAEARTLLETLQRARPVDSIEPSGHG